MVELGQLEARHADFQQRNIRLVAISQDDLENSKKTQEKFPHLQIVSDADHKIADALATTDPAHSHGGQQTNSPTTFLVDGDGSVRWIFRADRFLVRLSPDELLSAVDQHMPKKGS
jgi:peroxiredoxin